MKNFKVLSFCYNNVNSIIQTDINADTYYSMDGYLSFYKNNKLVAVIGLATLISIEVQEGEKNV